MEEMMIDPTSGNARFDHIPQKPITDSAFPSWKLYENPFYINSQRQIPHKSTINKHLQYCLKLASSSSICDLTPVRSRMDSELDLARSQIVELKTELRYERKARKKVESLAKRLAKELDEERKGREAIERLCQELAREISSHEAQIDQMKKEIEEERKMLRLAEILREERVQMKLSEVKIVFEDMLLELEDRMRRQSEGNEAAGSSTYSDSVTKLSGKLKQTSEKLSVSSNNSGIANGSSTESTRSDVAVGDQRASCNESNIEIPAVEVPRRASPELENPHIMRGIKGFVEFRRVVRVKESKSRDSDAKLECQKAQLRVLLKQKGPAVRSNNLIIS